MKTKSQSKRIAPGEKKIIKGRVVNLKNQKTVVVLVERIKAHRKYFNRYTVSKRYKVHSEKSGLQVGDLVKFSQSKSYSKDKKWEIL